MRATRGLLASLGASTALVLAAAAALFSVSAIVAFRGWPGVEAPLRATGDDRIAVASVAGPGMSGAQAGRIVVPEVRAPRRSAAVTPRVQRPAPVYAQSTVVSRPRAAVRRRIPDSVNGAGGQGGPAAAAPPAREPAPADGVREVGSEISETVGGVAGGLGDAVRPVSPALGRTLDQAGRSLEQTIGGVAGAVGTTVDSVMTGNPPR